MIGRKPLSGKRQQVPKSLRIVSGKGGRDVYKRQAAIKDAFGSIDKKAVFQEAKNLFTSMRKDGSLNDVGGGVDISDEEE